MFLNDGLPVADPSEVRELANAVKDKFGTDTPFAIAASRAILLIGGLWLMNIAAIGIDEAKTEYITDILETLNVDLKSFEEETVGVLGQFYREVMEPWGPP